MTNMNTSTQLMDIATRIKGMREILGYSMQKMAEQTEVSEEIYHQYESGTVDIPFTFCINVPRSSVWRLPFCWKVAVPSCPVIPKGLVTASEEGITI